VAKREVWHPALYERGDVSAIQALYRYAQLAEVAWDVGTMGSPPPAPSEFEVKRALDWIINQAAQTYDNSFVPDDPNGRMAAFIEGRRSVGQQIVKLMRLSGKVLEGRDKQE
jgi:hypothetical protein